MVLFTMLYKVDPTFESVDECLKCEKQEKAVLSRRTVNYAVQGEILKCNHSNESN